MKYIVLVIALSGCAHNPYADRNIIWPELWYPAGYERPYRGGVGYWEPILDNYVCSIYG